MSRAPDAMRLVYQTGLHRIRSRDPGVLLQCESISHAGDIVGYGPHCRVRAGIVERPLRAVCVIIGHQGEVIAERCKQGGYSRVCTPGHLLHMRMRVELLAQKLFERHLNIVELRGERNQRAILFSNGIDTLGTGLIDFPLTGLDDIGDELVDHRSDDFSCQSRLFALRILAAHVSGSIGKEGNRLELPQIDQPGTDAVIDIVVVVGDFIRQICDLCFEAGLFAVDEPSADVAELPGILRGAMLENAFASLEAEIEAVEACIPLFELVDDSERLQIVLEATEVAHAGIERILSGVAERCVAKIVRQADGFDQILVESKGSRDRASYLGHLERVRETGSVEIPFVN